MWFLELVFKLADLYVNILFKFIEVLFRITEICVDIIFRLSEFILKILQEPPGIVASGSFLTLSGGEIFQIQLIQSVNDIAQFPAEYLLTLVLPETELINSVVPAVSLATGILTLSAVTFFGTLATVSN